MSSLPEVWLAKLPCLCRWSCRNSQDGNSLCLELKLWSLQLFNVTGKCQYSILFCNHGKSVFIIGGWGSALSKKCHYGPKQLRKCCLVTHFRFELLILCQSSGFLLCLLQVLGLANHRTATLRAQKAHHHTSMVHRELCCSQVCLVQVLHRPILMKWPPDHLGPIRNFAVTGVTVWPPKSASFCCWTYPPCLDPHLRARYLNEFPREIATFQEAQSWLFHWGLDNRTLRNSMKTMSLAH